MSDFSKIKYWYDKIPEIQLNLEPLTQLMIRTVGEANIYLNRHVHSKTIKIVSSKDINLLHAIDRASAIKKLVSRVKFLKKHKKEIKMLEKKNGFVDLSSDIFIHSSFASINSEVISEVANNKFVTLSGVGRTCAIKIVFPAGLRIRIMVGTLDRCLVKRLISLNNLFIYSNRFTNLKKYGINEKEIIYSKRVLTKKCYNRGNFIKTHSRKLLTKFIPLK